VVTLDLPLYYLDADASPLQKGHAPPEAGPVAAGEALKLQEGQDAALQAAAENSRFTKKIPSVVLLQG
jgi:hypothetical protein